MKKLFKRINFSLLAICLCLMSVNIRVEASHVIENAIGWALATAEDNSHGYSQITRWGPDYDCSSFVISAFKAAGVNTHESSYTGNMIAGFTKAGFDWIPWSEIQSEKNLRRGDILLHPWSHTELYLGNHKMVGAHQDFGYPSLGDQNGLEISVVDYNNSSNWQGVLRKNVVQPSGPTLSLNGSIFTLQDEIQVKAVCKEATDFKLSIWKENKLVKSMDSKSGEFTFLAEDLNEGSYSCQVSCENLVGKVETERVDFKILEKTGWIYEDGWKYIHEDGSMTVNDFETIDGLTYYFDGASHYVTGWQYLDSDWYYFDIHDGHMASNEWIDDEYVSASGKWIDTGWVLTESGWQYIHEDTLFTQNDFETIDGLTYYFDENGHYVKGWQYIQNDWYFFYYNDGHMAQNEWMDGCYLGEDGTWLKVGWVLDESGWRYIHTDGAYTQNDFEWIDGCWYFFDANGHYIKGWQQIDNVWYFFYYNDGHMAQNEWIDGCYLSSTGSWIQSVWEYDGQGWRYYESDGCFVKDSWKTIDGLTYYFDENGHYMTGWQHIAGSWYYFYPSDGHMAMNETIDGHYVDDSGVWVQ